MSVPLKLDITTGDKITPKEITYEFKLILEDRSIHILAYNLETILSEKFSEIMQNHWRRYQRDFEYAKDISFDETCISVSRLMDEIFE